MNLDLLKWEDRNIRLFGLECYKKLISSHVMVIGIGGVGSWAAEAIGRSGIRRITLIDEDYICATNINRQIHAVHSVLGVEKVTAMKKRLEDINPFAKVTALNTFYNKDIARKVFSLKPDIIIDAIDNITTKLHLIASCIYLKQPIITCFGASAKLDPSKIKFTELRKTHKDPLAKSIRKNLWRKYKINLQRVRNLYALFSEEELFIPKDVDFELKCDRRECKNFEGQGHTCIRRRRIYGTFAPVTGAMGLLAAGIAIKYLANILEINLKPEIIVYEGDESIMPPL